MNRDEYRRSARKIRIYGTIILATSSALSLALALTLMHRWDEHLHSFGRVLRARFDNEVIHGIIAGCIAFVWLARFVLIPFMLLILYDRRVGKVCPNCGRSLTLRCVHSRVLTSGKCGLCSHDVFRKDDVPDLDTRLTDLPSKPPNPDSDSKPKSC